MKRRLTLDQARAQYVHRYTCDHVPQWALDPITDTGGKEHFCAPHYASDAEWYANTTFPGEGHIHGNSKHCETRNMSWPLGAAPLHVDPREAIADWRARQEREREQEREYNNEFPLRQRAYTGD